MKKFVIASYEKRRQVGNHSWHFQRYEYCCSRDSKRQGYCQVCSGGKVMFNNVGDLIDAIVVKVQPNKQPEVVSEHQCIGNPVRNRWF